MVAAAFFQVALPIIVTFILATWYQAGRITDLRESLCKRIDDLRGDMNIRFQCIDRHLDRLDEKVESLIAPGP